MQVSRMHGRLVICTAEVCLFAGRVVVGKRSVAPATTPNRPSSLVRSLVLVLALNEVVMNVRFA